MSLLRQYTGFLLITVFSLLATMTSAQADNRDEVIFFFNDALGSAVAAVNESGELCWSEEYTGYGDKSINDDVISVVGCGIVGEERGFTGHTEDVNSDLVYMQQRYYDPSIGRFLSIDPLDANPESPKTFNRYAYANNNPYKYVDPDGRAAIVVGLLIIGAGVEAYDLYQAYKEGGVSGLAQQAATDAVMSAAGVGIPAKLAGRLGGLIGKLSGRGDVVPDGDVAKSGVERAEALRDAELDRLSGLSNTQRDKVSTVVGAHDPKTGNIAIGIKRRGCDSGRCAEDLAAEALGNPDPKTIEFTSVVRPRTQDVIPRCDRCTDTFGPE